MATPLRSPRIKQGMMVEIYEVVKSEIICTGIGQIPDTPMLWNDYYHEYYVEINVWSTDPPCKRVISDRCLKHVVFPKPAMRKWLQSHVIEGGKNVIAR